MVDGRDSAWRNRAPGPHAHRTTARKAMDGLWTEAHGQQKQSNDPSNNQHILNTPIIGRHCRANGTACHIQYSPNTPTTGLRERGSDTSKSTGRSGRQNAATRRNLRREERVAVQGPVKEQQPDGMSDRGWTRRGRIASQNQSSPPPPSFWGIHGSNSCTYPAECIADEPAPFGCFGGGCSGSSTSCWPLETQASVYTGKCRPAHWVVSVQWRGLLIR